MSSGDGSTPGTGVWLESFCFLFLSPVFFVGHTWIQWPIDGGKGDQIE